MEKQTDTWDEIFARLEITLQDAERHRQHLRVEREVFVEDLARLKRHMAPTL